MLVLFHVDEFAPSEDDRSTVPWCNIRIGKYSTLLARTRFDGREFDAMPEGVDPFGADA
jgi:hypothetical protein